MMLNRKQFVELYTPAVERITAGTGIFPQTLLAIAIVESQAQATDGNFYPGQSILVKRANNYFGIKNSPAWKGPTVTVNTPKDAQKVSTFRRYNSFEESAKDFVKFIKENRRYKDKKVLQAPTYQEQIIRIASAGYAESPTYRDIVVKVANSITDAVNKSIAQIQKSEPLISSMFALALTAVFFILNSNSND